MDRRTRAVIVVVVAALLASIAAYGVFQAIQTQQIREVPVAARFTVVAARTIPVGTQLTPEMIRVAGWPADAPVAGGFAKPEEVLGRGVTVGLVENEPILESKLAAKGTAAGLASVIPPGMRAIAVRVNDVISVAGYTLPGSRVDVIVTLNPGQESISRIVISNVQVLSIGQSIDTGQAREGKAAQNPPLVTLALSPVDAERLALASTQGQIMLALRNPMDTESITTSGARVSALFGGSASAEPVKAAVRSQPRPAAALPPPPAPKPPSVEVIMGTTRKEQIIKK